MSKGAKLIKKSITKREGIKFVVASLLAIVILISILVLIYNNFVVFKTQEYDVKLEVSNNLGFDVSEEYIGFGKITPGGTSNKKLEVLNDYGREFNVQVKVEGNASKFIYLKDKDIILRPYENKTIELLAIIPKNEPYGEYAGKLVLIFRRF